MNEQLLERLNTNIEALIAVLGSQAGSLNGQTALNDSLPTQTTATPPAAMTVHDVQAALVALAKKSGREPAAEILSLFGASRVGDIKLEDYRAVLNRIEEADGQ